MKKLALYDIIDKFPQQKIMVIGDIIADVYLDGKISRISREAPVLVLEYDKEKIVPGGAGNVINNAAALGGRVYAVGLVGKDSAAEGLLDCFSRRGVDTEGLVAEEGRPTITKTRIFAGGLATVRQQVVRIDRELKTPLSAASEEKILACLSARLKDMDAVILSDYGSGVLTPRIRRYAIDACRSCGIPVMVDSRYDILNFAGVNFVKQNEAEAAAALELPELNADTLVLAGRRLLGELNAEGVLITRGAEGMTLFGRGGSIDHVPVANVSEVYDVTGAGDTVVAAMMLAKAAGADALMAAVIANHAAGVVVRKLGTATLTATELKQAIGDSYENN